jgi:TM2 domain-containing membrane protein YozV
MEKVWVIRDPHEQLQGHKTRRLSKEALPSDGKNPASAYSLSIICWGAGQFYNNQRGKGALFFFTMLIFFTGIFLSFLYVKFLLQVLGTYKFSVADVFLAAELLLFLVLMFWTYNAGDAYHTAVKARAMPFAGIQNQAYPFLCSLLLPGWGQFLNGQPIKGSIYAGLSVLSIFASVSIPSIIFAWPFLEAVKTRSIIEEIFALAVLFAPLIPFIWIFGSFDALKVSLDDIKKESFLDRISYANNRRRMRGWMKGVFPHIKLTIALFFLLILLVIVLGRSFPMNYYSDKLTQARARFESQGMTIVPELIGRLLSLAVSSGK